MTKMVLLDGLKQTINNRNPFNKITERTPNKEIVSAKVGLIYKIRNGVTVNHTIK